MKKNNLEQLLLVVDKFVKTAEETKDESILKRTLSHHPELVKKLYLYFDNITKIEPLYKMNLSRNTETFLHGKYELIEKEEEEEGEVQRMLRLRNAKQDKTKEQQEYTFRIQDPNVYFFVSNHKPNDVPDTHMYIFEGLLNNV